MKLSETEIEEKLLKLLGNSVKSACDDEKRIGVVFSAGLDSTVIAFLAKRFSGIVAYTVGSEVSEDVQIAEKMKKLVDFDIKIKKIEEEDIKRVLPNVLGIIEKNGDPLQVSCAVPVYIAAGEAKKDGIGIMLSGQGSDELFGGYNRYLQHTSDYEKLKAMMKKDAEHAYEDNLYRDIAMCKAQEIELRFPLMDEDLVKFVIEKIPIELKIKEVRNTEFSCIDAVEGRKFVRKYVLRKVAKKIGIPEIVINRPKKALQYGSHSMKILGKIAKDEGFKSDVKSYLENLAKGL